MLGLSGQGFKPTSKTRIGGVHLQLLAGLGIGQGEQAQVGQRHLQRVIQAQRHDLMPPRKPPQGVVPAGLADEVGDHEHQRAAAQQALGSTQQITEHGDAGARGRAFAQAADQRQHLPPAHARRHQARRLARAIEPIQQCPDAIAMAGDQPGQQRHQFLGHLALGALGRTELDAAGEIDQEPCGEIAVFGVLAHMGHLQPCGDVPVDVAHVIAMLVFAQIRQVESTAAPQRAVIALQQPVEAAQHRPLQAAQQRVGGGSVVLRHGQPGCCMGRAGTGTCFITRSMRSSALKPSASAS
jgi:hypothetical protein